MWGEVREKWLLVLSLFSFLLFPLLALTLSYFLTLSLNLRWAWRVMTSELARGPRESEVSVGHFLTSCHVLSAKDASLKLCNTCKDMHINVIFKVHLSSNPTLIIFEIITQFIKWNISVIDSFILEPLFFGRSAFIGQGYNVLCLSKKDWCCTWTPLHFFEGGCYPLLFSSALKSAVDFAV